jgi:putative SOS response-associated peptidase YedK
MKIEEKSIDFVFSPSNLESAVKNLGIPSNPKLFIPKNSVHVGDHLPIIRLEQQHGQRDLFDPNGYRLSSARFGLVPNEFSSSRESDRYKLHAIRAERIEYQRAVSRVFAQTRCVIPVQSARLEGVGVLEDRGEVIWLAGMWTRYERPSARVESCAVITRLNRVDDSRALIELKVEEFATWLEPSTAVVQLERWSQPFGIYKNAQLASLQQVATIPKYRWHNHD